jgi:flagellar motility protein MotE (MotC chaperone)
VGWISSELGVVSFRSASAAEKPTSAPVSVEALEKALNDRGKSIDEREAKIAQREKAVGEKEALLQQQLGKYEQIVDDLKKKIKTLEEQQSAKVESFRKVYEGMDGKRAARILEDVDLGLATEILSGMKTDKAAEILGRMNPIRAKQITERSMRQARAEKVSGQ